MTHRPTKLPRHQKGAFYRLPTNAFDDKPDPQEASKRGLRFLGYMLLQRLIHNRNK